jgi:DNA-directed RNA polymerase subunit M/transcription elongation factor TFIIS
MDPIAREKNLAARLQPKFEEALLTTTAGGVSAVDRTTVVSVAQRIAAAVAALGCTAAIDTAKQLVFHLKDPLNNQLRANVLSGAIAPCNLVKMSEYDLVNPEVRALHELLTADRARARDYDELRAASALSTEIYPCPKCGAREAKMDERQTRSGDEPMTIFLTCFKCNHVWIK